MAELALGPGWQMRKMEWSGDTIWKRCQKNGGAYGQILLACLIWGTYGVYVQVLHYPAVLIVFFRFFFGLVTMVGLAAYRGQLMSLLPTRQSWLLILACLINFGSWMLLTQSIMASSVANGFVLYYTAPCFVVLFAPVILGEKIKTRAVMALGLCFSGIVTMVGMDVFSGSQLSIQATLMGLASGVCYAFYILLLKKIPKQLLGLVSNAYVCGVITLAAFPMAVNHFDQLTWGGLAVLIICGVTIQGIATTAYMNGLRQVKAQQASILSYTEALFATIFSVIFLQETVSLNLFLGACLIVGGGMLVIVEGKADRGKPMEKI